jgi:hypothetical protein
MATLNRQVGGSTDDAQNSGSTWPGTGNYTATGMTLQLGVTGTAFYLVGVRFTDVNIPQGATINAADIQLCANGNSSQQLNVTLAAENVDNAATFSSGHQPKDAYASATSAQVVWNIGTAPWSAGSWYTSVDISSVIQEIVNLAGWASGGALNVLLWNTGKSLTIQTRTIRSWDYSGHASGPKLDITYTPSVKIPVFMAQYRKRRAD